MAARTALKRPSGMPRGDAEPVDPPQRRRLLLLVAATPLASFAQGVSGADANPDLRWYQAAEAMLRRAQSWNDQPYGAVLVRDGVVVGEGPSRVIRNQDPSAHAEREAIRDAQRRLGSRSLRGAVLYSTSRPCPLCEEAAALAQVSRMVFGPQLQDAGAPRAPAQPGG